ncbi:conserved hypothetical protein [Ricinus communis]|uniref:Uncharacterized protein n=1 Tax=Ricinus communis TaxID=3988 RepID=B9RVL5_RICCO|nr:conserved hypothetical protein [Ricinus communis]
MKCTETISSSKKMGKDACQWGHGLVLIMMLAACRFDIPSSEFRKGIVLGTCKIVAWKKEKENGMKREKKVLLQEEYSGF